MTNFEKVKEEFKITDCKTNPGEGFCEAILRIREDETENCCDSCGECYDWLRKEYKPVILNFHEKEYLYAVIRPWIDRVESIVKYNYDGQQLIQISIKDGRDTDLPFFEAGSMYKGMEVGKKYSLEELRLLEE